MVIIFHRHKRIIFEVAAYENTPKNCKKFFVFKFSHFLYYF